jgi:hypothetical protein
MLPKPSQPNGKPHYVLQTEQQYTLLEQGPSRVVLKTTDLKELKLILDHLESGGTQLGSVTHPATMFLFGTDRDVETYRREHLHLVRTIPVEVVTPADKAEQPQAAQPEAAK